MNDENKHDNATYHVWTGEPYVGTDWQGKLVILQEERLIRNGNDLNIMQNILNDNPSEAEIFKIRLTNPWDSDKPNPLRMPKNEQE